MQVYSADEMMLITDRGTLVRTRVDEVSITSRNTQGVMLIRLGNDEKLVKTVRIDEPENGVEGEPENGAEGEAEDAPNAELQSGPDADENGGVEESQNDE